MADHPLIFARIRIHSLNHVSDSEGKTQWVTMQSWQAYHLSSFCCSYSPATQYRATRQACFPSASYAWPCLHATHVVSLSCSCNQDLFFFSQVTITNFCVEKFRFFHCMLLYVVQWCCVSRAVGTGDAGRAMQQKKTKRRNGKNRNITLSFIKPLITTCPSPHPPDFKTFLRPWKERGLTVSYGSSITGLKMVNQGWGKEASWLAATAGSAWLYPQFSIGKLDPKQIAPNPCRLLSSLHAFQAECLCPPIHMYLVLLRIQTYFTVCLSRFSCQVVRVN